MQLPTLKKTGVCACFVVINNSIQMNIYMYINVCVYIDYTNRSQTSRTDIVMTVSSAVAPSRTQVLSLYRQFIKGSRRFTNYNFREYFLRKYRADFRSNMALRDAGEIAHAFQEAQGELGTLKRQSVISQLYKFDKTVIEPLSHNKKHA